MKVIAHVVTFSCSCYLVSCSSYELACSRHNSNAGSGTPCPTQYGTYLATVAGADVIPPWVASVVLADFVAPFSLLTLRTPP